MCVTFFSRKLQLGLVVLAVVAAAGFTWHQQQQQPPAVGMFAGANPLALAGPFVVQRSLDTEEHLRTRGQTLAEHCLGRRDVLVEVSVETECSTVKRTTQSTMGESLVIMQASSEPGSEKRSEKYEPNRCTTEETTFSPRLRQISCCAVVPAEVGPEQRDALRRALIAALGLRPERDHIEVVSF